MAVDDWNPVGIVPADHTGDRLGEAQFRSPAQGGAGAGRVENYGGDVIGGGRHDSDGLGQSDSEASRDRAEHFCDRMALAGRDIEETGRGIVAQHDPHQREEIRDVQEIADRIGAEAFLSGFEPLIKDWNGSDREARSGNVGEPQRNPWEIADREISLSGSLGDAVTGERADRMLDRYRNPLATPVEPRGLKIYEPLNAHVPRRLDGIDRTLDVGR